MRDYVGVGSWAYKTNGDGSGNGNMRSAGRKKSHVRLASATTGGHERLV